MSSLFQINQDPTGTKRGECEERCRRNVQPTCYLRAGYYLSWVHQISRGSVDIPPNSSVGRLSTPSNLMKDWALASIAKEPHPSRFQATPGTMSILIP